jgi:hypothetical protein
LIQVDHPLASRYNIYDHTPAQWGAIFRLADQWDAPVIRDLALSKIQSAQMDMAEKLRVLLRYKAPREAYYPLMEILVSHDELPEDLLSVYVGGSRIDETNDIPDGAAAPQAPQSSHEEGSVFLIPPASTQFTTSTGSTNSNCISENGNSPSVMSISCYNFNYLLMIDPGACFIGPGYPHHMRREKRSCRPTTRQ